MRSIPAAFATTARRGRSFARRAGAPAILFAFLLTVGACGDTGEVGSAKLKNVATGSTRDAVLDQLGRGTVTAEGVDTMRLANGHRLEEFFQDGTTYTVLWYREQPGTLADTVRRATDTPVVFQGDSMTGWGWDFYMQWASEKGIPKPPLP